MRPAAVSHGTPGMRACVRNREREYYNQETSILALIIIQMLMCMEKILCMLIMSMKVLKQRENHIIYII